MQREWNDKPSYLDVPGVIYHYPERYFPYINGFERFLYYRPQRGAIAAEASTCLLYTSLAELVRKAEATGANGIIGLQFQVSETDDGSTKVLAFGEAVLLEPLPR